MIFMKIQPKPINGEDFKQCLKELDQVCIQNGMNDYVLILDNARIHHYRGLNDIINEKNIVLDFLPP